MTAFAPPARFGPPLLAGCLALALVAPATWGQGASTGDGPAAGQGAPDPAVFHPPVVVGPGYVPPPDAGTGPTGGDDDDGGSGPGTGKTKQGAPPGSSGRGNSPRAGRTGPSGGRTGSERGDTAGPATAGSSHDRWQDWWESNKFDFIELRRLEDAPMTGQGLQAETAAQRELRLAGVRRLEREIVAPRCRELASSADANVRAAAIVALGKLRGPEAVDVALSLLKDGNLSVRRAALLSLGVSSAERGSFNLSHIAADTHHGRDLVGLQSLSTDDRGTALVVSALRGGKITEPLVLDLLDRRDELAPELLMMVADAAGLMASLDALDALIEIAFDARRAGFVRSAAVSALGRIGEPAAIPALLELLNDDIEPRRAAAVALGAVADGGATTVMARLALAVEHDSDAATRHFSAITLGRIGGPLARDALLARLDADPPADMRPWLALGLALTPRDAADRDAICEQLALLAPKQSSDTLGAFAIALGLCRSPRSIPVLADLLGDGSVEVAGHAALALGLSEQREAVILLRSLLATSTSPVMLRQTALALGILGDTSAVPSLVELIRTTANPAVASYASIGIAFMGDADAVGPLLQLIEHEGARGLTATWAVAALGQIFDTDRRPALSRLAAGDNFLARADAVESLLAFGF